MAAQSQCPTLISDGVYGQVLNVMGDMWGNAQTAFNVSLDALQELGHLDLHPIGVGVHFNPDTDLWRVLRPVGPLDPNIVWDPDGNLVPSPPDIDTGPDPAFVAPPTFTAVEPIIPDRTGPGPLTAVPPDGPPPLFDIEVPDAPDVVIPDFPLLREIVLPEVPLIVIPDFQGVRPDFNLVAPGNNFGFNVEEYTSTLATAISAKLQVMLNGDVGLPSAAVAQMRDRLYSALDTLDARAQQEAVEQFASRGFPQPNGTLNRNLVAVRQDAQDKRAAAARDIFLKDIDIAIENLRFAVSNGIAWETQLQNNFVAIQAQMIDVAKFSMTIAIEVFNAQVALANLELQMYQADASVYRDLIQAELAKIELYKGQLEGQKLIGELNLQDVQVFEARVKAIFSIVELYKAEIDGAKAKADINVAITQAFVAQVSAYSERVKAYDSEWNAFAKQLDADLSKYRQYELATQVFANRIKIWSDTNTNLIDQKRLRISDKELDLKAYDARLEQLRTVLTSEVQRIQAEVSIFQARIEKYKTDGQIEAVISEGNGRIFQLAVTQEAERVQTELKNAEIQITQATELTKVLVGAKQAIAQIGAQLAAGFASAMSVHAGISSSLSQSLGCETRFNYSISD